MEEIEARLRRARGISPDPAQFSALRSSSLEHGRPLETEKASVLNLDSSNETRPLREDKRIEATFLPRSENTNANAPMKPSWKYSGTDFHVVEASQIESQHSTLEKRPSLRPKEEFFLNTVRKKEPRYSDPTDFPDRDGAELAVPDCLSPRRMATTEPNRRVKDGGEGSAHTLFLSERNLAPPHPPLSRSTSTVESSLPSTPLSLCSPTEDQIRRQPERPILHQGLETLELGYQSQKPSVLKLPTWQNDDEDEGEYGGSGKEDHWWRPGQPDCSPTLFGTRDRRAVSSAKPRRRQKKGILSIFQRRSSVERLIDMYFDD
ncbi:hypothetical protein A1O3_09064 [Capronia epimyces CBS 606.96]|uniref:Uncharacterized protein n=1 Tax=Capronia epimyces CBS 606.96 TaxID=1182542 RepID=W9XKR8_9EURO|nr:uncharacterized protein A1O3_09064 [Capronia epimyces CBS 606.96]EXJ77905.1 hypothetical protein A1O3_09064 [Capronia epimyces CBS 606.96]